MTNSVVTTEMIAAAEQLMGIVYTANERAQMIGNLDGQIASAVAQRAKPLPNSVPTASRFDPRLPGFRMQSGVGIVCFSSANDVPLPAKDEDIAFAPLTQLSFWIASGKLSSQRLTRIYLDRIAEFGPRLECFATVTSDLALAEADAADALLLGGVNLGPLHGIPYALKDLFDTSRLLKNSPSAGFEGRIIAVVEADFSLERSIL